MVDIMLGAIALVKRVRNLQSYVDDLRRRGQDANRIQAWRSARRVGPAWCTGDHSLPPSRRL